MLVFLDSLYPLLILFALTAYEKGTGFKCISFFILQIHTLQEKKKLWANSFLTNKSTFLLVTSTISDGRGDHLSCRQVFAYHWEAADCAGMKLAADQCLLFYGSLPGKGDQCDRGFPQWCCASTWVRWRSWGEHPGAQECSIWKRNSGAIKHMGGGMATGELPWENQQRPARGLEGWGMKPFLSLSYDAWSTALLGYYTPVDWFLLYNHFRLLWCHWLKGCISVLRYCKQRPFVENCSL